MRNRTSASIDHRSTSARVKSGFVYVVRSSDGLYKIGRTSKPIRDRLEALRGGIKGALSLEHQCYSSDVADLEVRLHSCFANQCDHGEWFRLSSGDIAQMLSIFRTEENKNDEYESSLGIWPIDDLRIWVEGRGRGGGKRLSQPERRHNLIQ